MISVPNFRHTLLLSNCRIRLHQKVRVLLLRQTKSESICTIKKKLNSAILL
nr:MAG TPA_asm: hypothetical protein [Bacteriophage sp.]